MRDVCYKSSMRLTIRILPLIFAYSFLPAACGGRAAKNDLAEGLIVSLPKQELSNEDVEIQKVLQLGQSEAIVETRVRTAFRLEKVRGKWVAREFRIGQGQWEKIGNLTQILEAVKIQETRESLNRIEKAIEKYRQINGHLPVFKDYIVLSDILSPKYLSPLIRLDAWRQPFAAQQTDPDSALIFSAGPDGQYYTEDDIKIRCTSGSK